MTLRVCTACRRHFGQEAACPFCAAVAPASEPRTFAPAGVSRAAVFASATLAGCWTSNAPPQNAPSLPSNQQQQQQHVDFAKPPVAGSGRIVGTVLYTGTNVPWANMPVTLVPQDSEMPNRSVQTDASGSYVFDGLVPGAYRLMFGYSNHPRRPAPERAVNVTANDTQTVDMQIAPPPQPTHLPTPYGAPPARRRIV